MSAVASPTSGLAVGLVVGFIAALMLLPRAGAEEFNPFADRPAATPYSHRVIVQLRPEAGTAAAAKPLAPDRDVATAVPALGRRAGLEARSLRRIGPGLHVVQIGTAGMPATREAALAVALERLRSDPAVAFAEPDALVWPHRVPNDPGLAEQWYLLPPAAGSSGTSLAATDAVAAWDATIGAPEVVVAVIDSGVRFEHPDLRAVADGGKLLPGYDFVSAEADGTTVRANDGDGWDDDPSDPGDWVSAQDREVPELADCAVTESSWHGTRVAGMLAGLTDNGAGIAGLGWSTRILPVRALGKCGGFSSDVIAAMRWAAGLPQPGAPPNPTPARVLNLSLGGEGECSSAYQAAVDEITARGVLVVVSAGNDGSEVDRPANCRGAVAVTGVRHVGTKVGFANLGPAVALAAPGGNCVNVRAGEPCLYSLDTTTNFGSTVPGPDGYTDRLAFFNVGTSFAAPLVAGVAALMYSVHGGLPPGRVLERMQASATPFPVNPALSDCRVPLGSGDAQLAECNCTTTTCGAGIVHASRAVQEALRPLAVITAPAVADPGATVVLRAIGSASADGRPVDRSEWSVVSGAASLTALAGAETSFVAPASGIVIVRLVVTDEAGRSDAVDARVTVSGSTAPPPAPPPSGPVPTPPPLGGGGGGSGGGSFDAALLALLLVSVAGLHRRRCAWQSATAGLRRCEDALAIHPGRQYADPRQ